jgi:hypothetical protein
METLLIYTVCFASQEAVHDRYSHVHLPVHGTLHKKTLYGFFGKKDNDFGLDAISINNPSNDRSKVYHGLASMGFPGNNFRHHIEYNSIWISTEHISLNRLKFADLDLYNPKNWKAYFEKYPDSTPHEINPLTLCDKYEKIARKQFGYGLRPPFATDVLGFGSVPTSEASCKSYILPKKTKEFEIWDSHFQWNEKTKGWETKPVARFKKFGQWAADLDSSDLQKRDKAFDELEKVGDMARTSLEELLARKPSAETCRRAEMLLTKIASGRSKRADGLWEDADNYEKFPSLFAEDFYFFLRKNDYYFVTESGKLYHAPPCKEGEKSRTMNVLWNGLRRPIGAVIEDADHDKVWLFAKDKNAGAKLDLYFEMKDTIETKSFDPTKLRPVNVEGRAKLLLEYLPLVTKKGS